MTEKTICAWYHISELADVIWVSEILQIGGRIEGIEGSENGLMFGVAYPVDKISECVSHMVKFELTRKREG
jgi:hypothetical protein